MTTFATRRISQETFDAVVRENVEDFDMDAAEAVREAREQFEHQGVDLTGVDVSGSEERKAERAALVADVALVKKAAAGGVARPDLLEALARAATLCAAGRGRAAASARSTVVAAARPRFTSCVIFGACIAPHCEPRKCSQVLSSARGRVTAPLRSVSWLSHNTFSGPMCSTDALTPAATS